LIVSEGALDRKYLRYANGYAKLAKVHRTARLYRLNGQAASTAETDVVEESSPPRTWPLPIAVPVPSQLERPPGSCLSRLLGRRDRREPDPMARIDFTPTDWRSLRSGWDAPTTFPNGVTVARVLGREASVDIFRAESATGAIAVRLWPHRKIDDDQWVRALLNDSVLGVQLLAAKPQIIEFDVPPDVWRDGRNLLVLQFSRVCCENLKKRRSAAVDWIIWGR
jgi:hypothetical protein